MKTKKTVFILPGFFSLTTEPGYQTIGKHFADNGYKVIYVEITWKYKRVADYIRQFKAIYLREREDVNVFLGFSYGALVAYLSAPDLKPDYLYLCSMAPYFIEDFKHIPHADMKEIGIRRWADIDQYSFDRVAKKIVCPVTVFYGENEQAFVKRRVRLTKEKINKALIIEVPDAGHCFSNDTYVAYVKKEISKLS